jgi:hypothetical protein
MPDSTDVGTTEPTPGATSGGTVTPSTTFAGPGEQPLTHQQFQQVRAMIEASERHADTKLQQMEQRIDSKLAQIPTHAQMKKTVRDAILWTLSIVLPALGLVYAFLSYGRDQFDTGIQFTTNTISYSLEAKKAADESKKQLKEVLDYLKRREETPRQSRPSEPNNP